MQVKTSPDTGENPLGNNVKPIRLLASTGSVQVLMLVLVQSSVSDEHSPTVLLLAFSVIANQPKPVRATGGLHVLKGRKTGKPLL